MKRLLMMPDGWPCAYHECRAGYFVIGDDLFLKSEYGAQGYCSSGEMFAGDRNSTVQPVFSQWEEYED